MRTIIAFIFLLLYFIISLPLMLLALIIGLISMNARDWFMLRFVQFGLRSLHRIGGAKITIEGFENIPRDEAVLFMGNHTSYFDVIISYPMMIRPTGYVAKKEIKKIPILPWIMSFVHCLFLDRDDPRAGLQTVLQAADNIKNGISMVIFPEGTRSKDGCLGDFKEGSFKIATKAKCSIVPMGITGTPELFENHSPWMKPAKVTVSFGTPIPTKDLSRSEQKALPALVRAEVAKLSGQSVNE